METECTAIVRFDLVAADLATLLDIVNEVDPIMQRQEGLLDSAMLVRDDRQQVVSIMRWQDRSCHERCRANPELLVAGAALMEMVDSGAVTMSVDVYEPAAEGREAGD
jgi:hypothetical protein